MIMNKLKEKHEEKYTPEQFRVWAHMIQMKKYESYENPRLLTSHFLVNQERKP